MPMMWHWRRLGTNPVGGFHKSHNKSCMLCRYGESRLASGPIDTKFAQMFEVRM